MPQGLLGLLAFTLLAWVFSENRTRVKARSIVAGLGLQFAFGLILLKIPAVKHIFQLLNSAVEALDTASTAGSSFVFGYLGGGTLPFDETIPGGSFVFAFKALPIIIVMSALSALLFHWKVIPVAVRGFGLLLQRTMRVGGALGVSCAANIFVGMVEAPIIIRPYMQNLTRSELFTVMTCGMATIAGTVLVLYATFIAPVVPDALGHILAASIMSAPAAILIAQVMVPETEGPSHTDVALPDDARSSMDAISQGTASGVALTINVAGLLIVLLALVSLCNQALGLLPDLAGEPITLQLLLGYIMSPMVWLAGIPWSEAQTAGSLMGTKTVLNEVLSYLQLAHLPAGALSEKSRIIMTYAMCGFANLGSLGVIVGGLTAIVPDRRDEILTLGPKSIVAGTLATLMTGAVVGLLY